MTLPQETNVFYRYLSRTLKITSFLNTVFDLLAHVMMMVIARKMSTPSHTKTFCLMTLPQETKVFYRYLSSDTKSREVNCVCT